MPEIEAFAPLIQATFGAGEVSGDDDGLDALPAEVRAPDLRVRLADRALRQTNPVLGVIARVLELAEQRLTASQGKPWVQATMELQWSRPRSLTGA